MASPGVAVRLLVAAVTIAAAAGDGSEGTKDSRGPSVPFKGKGAVQATGEGLQPGREALPGEFPFQVSVRGRAAPGREAHLCSGALVGSRRVLTAAVCVTGWRPEELHVVAGEERLFAWTGRGRGRGGEGVAREVEGVAVHPDFNGDDLAYNVAILTVDRPFPNISSVQPIDLQTSSEGNNCTITGWTMIFKEAPANLQRLRVLQAAVQRRGQCERRLRVAGVRLTNASLCAQTLHSGDVCSVEAGSVLTCDGALRGLSSAGSDCTPPPSLPPSPSSSPAPPSPTLPLVFTEVAALAPWIASGGLAANDAP